MLWRRLPDDFGPRNRGSGRHRALDQDAASLRPRRHPLGGQSHPARDRRYPRLWRRFLRRRAQRMGSPRRFGDIDGGGSSCPGVCLKKKPTRDMRRAGGQVWLPAVARRGKAERAGSLPDGQITVIACPALRKNISVFPKCKSVYIRRRPVPRRGVAQRHERGAGCGGRGSCSRRTRVRRTEKSCGPDAPTLASSFAEAIPRSDGGKKARSPGRARRKPLKPLRGECRVISGVT